MAGKKVSDNSKKAAGQARKADAAAAKAAAEDAKKAAAEDDKWGQGAKSNAKKEAETAKKAEQEQRKAEKAALLAEDESNTPGRAVPKKTKTAPTKPSRGLGAALASLDINGNDNKEKAMSGTGIDAGLGIFDVVDSSNIKLEQHPERRVRQAFAAFKARREQEMKDEGSKLNFSQRRQRIAEEFAKSPENPFQQAHVRHDATREEKRAAVQAEKAKKEAIFAEK